VRASELHDHCCPGVTSGVVLARYLQKAFPVVTGGSYFIHSVQPWCKEDAIITILNTTPGKRGYAVSYSTPEDRARWLPDVQNAATIVYRYNPQTKGWDGIVVGFDFGTVDCPAYGHSVIDKLCADLWYLDHLDHPEQFIQKLHQFALPAGVEPKSYARPGIDPMEMLGLTQ
jgi:formylmethanofuran dehydrogenase subunit E-like metal-binding protein